jgi:hypothetical protein
MPDLINYCTDDTVRLPFMLGKLFAACRWGEQGHRVHSTSLHVVMVTITMARLIMNWTDPLVWKVVSESICVFLCWLNLDITVHIPSLRWLNLDITVHIPSLRWLNFDITVHIPSLRWLNLDITVHIPSLRWVNLDIAVHCHHGPLSFETSIEYHTCLVRVPHIPQVLWPHKLNTIPEICTRRELINDVGMSAI